MNDIKPKKINIEPIDISEQNLELRIIIPVLILSSDEIIIPALILPSDEIVSCITNINNCIFDIASIWGKIETAEEIRKAINDLFIRFNTSPRVYTKHDYLMLLKLLAQGLLFLYERQILLGPNFSEIATFKDRILELKNRIAAGDSIVLPEDADTTLPSVEYLTGLENIEKTALALSALTQQEYFILDCGSSTLNI